MVVVDFVYALRINGGFFYVSLARRFRTLEGIDRRVLGMWVLYLQIIGDI